MLEVLDDSEVIRFAVVSVETQVQFRCCVARLALKQSLQSTGLPVEGLKGTESDFPH